MRKTIGLLLGLVVMVAAAWPPAALAQKPRAELPTYELGALWYRNDGIFELTQLDADRYVFTAAGHREIHLTKDLALMRTAGGTSWVEMSPPMRIVWPIEVGKWGV